MNEASRAEADAVSSSPVEAPVVATSGEPRAGTLPPGGSLWLWVAAGFLFLGVLWTGMFMASRHADTRSVPLATQGGRP